MSKKVTVRDVIFENTVAIAECSFINLEYARKEYQKSLESGKELAAISLIINNESVQENIDAAIELTVEDAEKIALHILNICGAIKYE